MKFINIAFSLLFVVSTDAASINKQFDEQVSQSYLRKSDRNVPGSPEDWLQSLNDARAVGQFVIGGGTSEPSALEWSADLANQAQGWANTLASECKNAVPDGDENPGDYGVTTILNVRNPANTVEHWMINGKYMCDGVLSNPNKQKRDSDTTELGSQFRHIQEPTLKRSLPKHRIP